MHFGLKEQKLIHSHQIHKTQVWPGYTGTHLLIDVGLLVFSEQEIDLIFGLNTSVASIVSL